MLHLSMNHARLVSAAAILLLAGCSSSAKPVAQQPAASGTAATLVHAATSPTPGAYNLTGTISAEPRGQHVSACDTYSLANVPVTVRDEHGTVLAVTQTGENVRPEPTPIPAEEQAYARQHGTTATDAIFRDYQEYDHAYHLCRTEFRVSVPLAAFYQIKIGTHDGAPYSFDQLQSMGWHLDLSLK